MAASRLPFKKNCISKSIKIKDFVKIFRTLEGHSDGVVCIDVQENTIVSGSRDCQIIMWNLSTGYRICTLPGHTALVNAVRFEGKILASGDDDGIVKIWNPDNGECLKSLKCHKMPIASIVIQDQQIVTFSNQKQICIYDMAKGECNHKVKTIRSSPGKGQHLGALMPLATDKFSVKLWDISTKKVVQELKGGEEHEGQICGIAIAKSFVITSGCDGKVKLWDSSTGFFIRDILSLKNQFLTNISVTESTLVGVRHVRNCSTYMEVICINWNTPRNSCTRVLRKRKLTVRN